MAKLQNIHVYKQSKHGKGIQIVIFQNIEKCDAKRMTIQKQRVTKMRGVKEEFDKSKNTCYVYHDNGTTRESEKKNIMK